MKSFLKYNWPSILWAAFIMWLCLVPSGNLPKIHIPNFDKIVHFTFYFTLAASMQYGWKRQTGFTFLQHNTFIKVFIVAALYGLTIEIMQETLTTTRHFEWLDEAANCVGALGGLVVSRLAKSQKQVYLF